MYNTKKFEFLWSFLYLFIIMPFSIPLVATLRQMNTSSRGDSLTRARDLSRLLGLRCGFYLIFCTITGMGLDRTTHSPQKYFTFNSK